MPLLRIMIALLPASRELFDPLIGSIAVLTLILAPMGAIAQTNLRRAIGFFVMGGIGAVFAGMAIANLLGVAGAIFYAFHSMLTMSAFYLVAGLVERVTQATDTKQMGGVYAANSLLSILFLILVFAAAGLPPFLGFWPKMLIVEAAISQQDWIIMSAVLVNSLLTSIAGTRLWAHIFWRPGRDGPNSEVPNDHLRVLNKTEKRMALGATCVLVSVIVILGLWPNLLFNGANFAARDLIDTQSYILATGIEIDGLSAGVSQ